jgi:hypothetical protein
VACGFYEFANQYFLLPVRRKLQLDEARRWCEGYDVDGFARTLGEVFATIIIIPL